MLKVFEYLRIAILLVGLLVGIQLPGIVDDYGQLLEARTMESDGNVSEFQDDANRFFAGDLNRLIEYYLANPDQVIVAGGESIGAIVSRNTYLNNALMQFGSSRFNAYYHVFLVPVPEIKEQLLENYQYSITLNSEAIGVGVGIAILCMMAFELLLSCRQCFRIIRGKTQGRSSSTRSPDGV